MEQPISKKELLDFAESWLQKRKFGISYSKIMLEILSDFFDSPLNRVGQKPSSSTNLGELK